MHHAKSHTNGTNQGSAVSDLKQAWASPDCLYGQTIEYKLITVIK